MAILASANWYVRAGGNALNGGGWDSAIAGAGVNYADADAAILSRTDLATTGAVATVTSAAGGFTSNMVGNCLRIASGTNFTPGYYFIVTFTDANTIVLDRVCATAAGSGGTGRIGGAFANMTANLSTGGTVTPPILTSPLAAGHTVNVRGAGTDTPASADYVHTGYSSYPYGNGTVGMIRLIGYNGRPRIDVNAMIYNLSGWSVTNFEFRATAADNPTYGRVDGASLVVNVRVNQQGFDVSGIGAAYVRGCELINSGSSAAGNEAAIVSSYVDGCKVFGWRGPGIYFSTFANFVFIRDSIFAGCKSTTRAAVTWVGAFFGSYHLTVYGCTFHGNAFDGLAINGNVTYDADVASDVSILNCIFSGNAGYGIRITGTLALNDRIKRHVDHNAFLSNTSGPMLALTAGPNDITLSADPFTNATAGDFTLNAVAGGGALLKGVAFPTSFPAS